MGKEPIAAKARINLTSFLTILVAAATRWLHMNRVLTTDDSIPLLLVNHVALAVAS